MIGIYIIDLQFDDIFFVDLINLLVGF